MSIVMLGIGRAKNVFALHGLKEIVRYVYRWAPSTVQRGRLWMCSLFLVSMLGQRMLWREARNLNAVLKGLNWREVFVEGVRLRRHAW